MENVTGVFLSAHVSVKMGLTGKKNEKKPFHLDKILSLLYDICKSSSIDCLVKPSFHLC